MQTRIQLELCGQWCPLQFCEPSFSWGLQVISVYIIYPYFQWIAFYGSVLSTQFSLHVGKQKLFRDGFLWQRCCENWLVTYIKRVLCANSHWLIISWGYKSTSLYVFCCLWQTAFFFFPLWSYELLSLIPIQLILSLQGRSACMKFIFLMT